MSWHVDHELLVHYQGGRLGDTASFSVEAHLVGCAPCRRLISDAIDPARRDQLWAGVIDRMDWPDPRRAERALARVGVPAHTARLLAMTPSIRMSWLLSMVTVLVAAVVASHSFGEGPFLFLVVAPLVPVAGIAVSFGRSIDPLYEVGLATPTGGFRLMLIRATSVLVSSLAVSMVPAVLLTEARWMVVWMIPALAVTVLTLLVSTVISVSAAAGVVCTLWLVGVAMTELGASTRYAAFGASAQMTFGGLALGSAALLMIRRQSFERVGHDWKETG